MVQAAANKGQITVLAESTYGAKPTTGTPEIQRITSEDVVGTSEFVTSDEIESSLLVVDNIRVDVGAGGGLQAEWAYGAQDTLIGWALNQASWSTQVQTSTISVNITADKPSAVNTLALASTNWNAAGNLTSALADGMWVHVSGFANAVNNGYHRVISGSTGTTLTVASATTMTNETLAGTSLTVTLPSQVISGTTFTSFALEREYTDLTNKWATYTGMVATGMEIGLSAKAKATIGFTLLGKDEASNTADMGDQTAARPSGDTNGTNKVFSVTSDAKSLTTATTAIAKQRFVSATIRVQKGDQAVGAAGELGAVDVSQGGFTITGDLELYYESETFFDQARANTELPLDFVVEDAAGNGYAISIPRAVLTEASRTLPGKDQPVIARYTWAAAKHATEAIMMRIARKAA